VGWQAPAGNGVTITGYRASASPGPATCSTDGALTCVLGGTAGTAYTVTVVALSAGGQSAASSPSGSVMPASPAVSDTPPETDLPLNTGDGAISSATPGQTIVLKGDGYAPYSSVTLAIYSSPTVLGTVIADVDGAFAKSVTIPAGLATGAHSLVASGVDQTGTVRSLRLDITVAGSGGGGTLPVTGPTVVWLIVGGFALTLAGITMRGVRPTRPATRHRRQ
jgi:titin